MATKKVQKNRMNSTGSYDVIHYETDADIVMMGGGTTVEDAVTNMQNKLSFHASQHAQDGSDPLTPAAIGAAPAGYGLGAKAKHLASWDDVSANGFFYANSDGPTSGWWFGVCKVAANDASRFVTVWKIGENGIWYKCERQYYAGVGWGSWEFANPPMTLGSEYRTTQRYDGKPVYVKRVNIPSMPAAAGLENRVQASLSVSDVSTIVHTEVECYSTSGSHAKIPYFGNDMTVLLGGYAAKTGGNIMYYIQASKDMSHYTGVLTAWYTKTTED